MARITNYIPVAAKYAKALVRNGEYRNVFNPEEKRKHYIESNGFGWCFFSYKTKKNKIKCSLHSAAIELGEIVTKLKPRVCTLWPLILVSSKPPLLTVQHDAYNFPCNSKSGSNNKTVDRGLLKIIHAAFGGEFYRKLIKLLIREGYYINKLEVSMEVR